MLRNSAWVLGVVIFWSGSAVAQFCPAGSRQVQNGCTHPTRAVLSDAWYFAKRVTLSLALRSSGDAGRGFGRVGAAAALVAG